MNTQRLLRALALIALFGASPLLAACHTTAGAAQDVSAAGRGITRGGQAVERSVVRNTP